MVYPVQPDPTAVFGRRVVAALIDATLVLVPVFMLISSQFEYFDAKDLPVTADDFCNRRNDASSDQICINFDGVDGRVYVADDVPGTSATAVFWLATIGMVVLLQGFTGWTLGKLITGIRTVGEDGQVAGPVKCLVRWLLWIVDGFPYFLPLVGFIVGLTTVGHRRVGDMVAKTFVVRSSSVGAPIVVPGLTAPPVPAGQPGWGQPAPGPTTDGGWEAAPGAGPVAPAPGPPQGQPQWDEARGTYIQWDPVASRWMQWDEGQRSWSPIPGQ